jgi:hypothetical protein
MAKMAVLQRHLNSPYGMHNGLMTCSHRKHFNQSPGSIAFPVGRLDAISVFGVYCRLDNAPRVRGNKYIPAAFDESGEIQALRGVPGGRL